MRQIKVFYRDQICSKSAITIINLPYGNLIYHGIILDGNLPKGTICQLIKDGLYSLIWMDFESIKKTYINLGDIDTTHVSDFYLQITLPKNTKKVRKLNVSIDTTYK